MGEKRRIVLIGFSGTGKSTVGVRLAHRLGWRLRDTDAEIEARHGQSIAELFKSEGESSFRAEERAALLAALATEESVIATGGGAVLADELWTDDGLRHPKTLVIALDAAPETIWTRLSAQAELEGGRVERPLLAGADPLARIETLKSIRQRVYDRADLTLSVENVNPDEVVEEIIDALACETVSGPFLTLETPSGRSEIFAGAGALETLPEAARARWPSLRRVWVAADSNVALPHGERVLRLLREAGLNASLATVPAGEGSKSIAGAQKLYDWLLDGDIERGDVVIALGGGVIGDLVGFVAATCLRGVGLVQIPTTLLAMVDSSIGGKTGLNHRAGKNLIGAFYQPSLVLIDPDPMATLPVRELTAGWAEIIKHGVIQPSTPGGERGDLLSSLARMVEVLRARREPALSWLIRRNVALKAAVVAADERETGLRAILNFGHTFGHAIEASDYRLLHGEAVAVGMVGAAALARELGLVGVEFVAELERLIEQFGLPVRAEVDPAAVHRLMSSDKKRVAGRQRWILPVATGGVEMHLDAPADAVERALATVAVKPGNGLS